MVVNSLLTPTLYLGSKVKSSKEEKRKEFLSRLDSRQLF